MTRVTTPTTDAPADGPVVPSGTEDRLLDGRVRLRQPACGYRVAIDPVLLAAAVPAKPGDRVVEPGIGTGAASLCLAARVPGLDITGVEIDPDRAALARRNADLNPGLNLGAAAFRVIEGDLADRPMAAGSADQVLFNPPYLEAGKATEPAAPGARTAAVEGGACLADWVGFAGHALRRGGHLTLIHRADRLDHVMAALAGGFGGVTLIPLWPRAGVAARRIIVTARRGLKSPAVLSPGLVLHDATGAFTPEAEAVLRHAAALSNGALRAI